MTKHTETTFTLLKVLPIITARLMVVRPIAVLPLIVCGLLALDSDGAHAQRCWGCDGDTCEEETEEGRFGFSACWMGEILGRDMCMPGQGSELCEVDGEEGGWALSPMEEASENEAVLALVRSGRMLPAESRYFISLRGENRFIRKKCGGSLVGVVAVHLAAEERGRAT